MFFSDLHVQILSRGILNPGEQLVGQTVTSYMPWWAFGFIRRQYLVLATDQRLILVDHRYSFIQPLEQRLHQVDSITWSNVQELKVKGLFLKKKLRVRGTGERGPISLTMPIPNGFFGLFAPMTNNVVGARGVEAAFQNMQQQAPALAAPQAYGQPQIAYAQAPQLAAPVPQSVPPQNAPGYASAPPVAPAPGPYGAAPAPAPFAQPTPGSYPPPRSWS
ncbi:MAG: hypothetical protein K0S65_5788 [Labilithrix sp.]|nr:hypothetical protein [Labilithrix sp.]